MKKRLLVFLLTIIMVLTMMPISAKAEEEKKFKAVYDSTAHSLTFYYDSIDHSGQVFDNLPTAARELSDWPYFSQVMRDSTQIVIFDESIQDFHGLTSTAYMIHRLYNLESIIGLEYLDTSKVTNMAHMFEACDKLTSIPGVSSWNTSEVTNMQNMFAMCLSMTTVPDVSNWVTTNLEDAGSMFSDYGKDSSTLNAVPDVSNWVTTNLKNASNMFGGYGSSSSTLKAVPDVSNWDTENLENVFWMFNNYGAASASLNEVPDVNNWKTKNIQDAAFMFGGYASNSTELEFVLDLSGWNMPAYTNQNPYGVDLINDSTARNAKKWTVIIPLKTGEEPNKANAWKVNDTITFTPPTGKVFTIPNIITNDIPDTEKDTNHGYISVPKNSLPGATVSMTVFPNSGYSLKTDSLKVSYNDGTTKTCELTPDATDETKYTFTMPGFDVTVTAEFVHNTHVFSGDYMEYDKTNHKWAKKCDCGEFDTANSLTGVEIPQAETGLIYNGEKQVSITKDYTDCCLIENYIAADAGRYIAKCTLDDGYIWSDGTTEVKNIEWGIAPMQLQDATAKNEEYTGTKITPTLSFSVADLVLGTDYTVGEWSGDLIEPGTYTAKVTFIGNYTGSANVSLTIKGANKSVVKFDLNNGATGGPENRMIDNGNKFSEPEAPTCEGYTFAGWYTDKNCTDGNEYDFESEVTKDIVLYAKWIKNTDPNPDPDDPSPNPDEVKKTDLLNIELANKINEAAKQGKTVVIYLTEYTGNDCLTRDNLKLLNENPNVILVLDYTFFDVDTKKDIHVHAVINKANISPVLNDDVIYFGPANLSGFVQYYNMLPAEIRNMNL